MKRALLALALGGASFGAAAQAVSFAEPADGAVVGSPFKVKFAVSGMEVKPAGEMAANTGHHHLIINGSSIKAGESIPFDDTHLHFGKGQTEAEVKLPPGQYKLTMQFANGAHQSYGPGASKTINVTVK
ncbi:rod shape-determining protein RodA [Massilia sp. Root351]|nr:rod shape-determining protein RodA [Massilia sp. Root351]